MVRPSPVTIVPPRMWSRTGPKPCRSGPDVPVATTEPSERSGWPGGSRASQAPWASSACCRRSSGTPVSTVATRSAGEASTMRVSSLVQRARSAGGRAGRHPGPPPLDPAPPPLLVRDPADLGHALGGVGNRAGESARIALDPGGPERVTEAHQDRVVHVGRKDEETEGDRCPSARPYSRQ